MTLTPGTRLARFKREAQVLAALNHPNIAHVYGFESAPLDDGTRAHFLAMELVEGEDLAERLQRGAIPVDEALAIARQIAEGLEEAHEKGIVHRDLKPANVKLTPDGKVKVLDFGLAKAMGGAASDSSGVGARHASPLLESSPTLTARATQAGMILGTAAYMSPEQARGKTVDKRADIWAFGVVLFEMLSGARLFTGDTVSDILAAVLTREPDWQALPPATPPALSRVLRRCLERDPKKRLHDIADARLDLEDAKGRTGDESGRPNGTGQGRRSPSAVFLLAGALALTLLGLLVGGFAATRLNPPPTPDAFRLATVLPLGDDFVQQASGFAISPDGSRVVFRHAQDGHRGLFLRSLAQLEPTFIPGSEEGVGPVFSPDGTSLAFFSMPLGSRGGGLYRITIEGGAPLHLAETGTSAMAGFTFAGHWTADGQILFAGSSPVIQRISAAGGPVTAVTVLDQARGEQRHGQPRLLPGGKGVLYVAVVEGGRQDVMVTSKEGAVGRVLVKGATTPRFSPTGHLLFVLESTIFAAPFDLDTLDLTGEPFPVAGSGEAVRLTRTAEDERAVFPRVWLRDGSALVFHSIRASGDIGLWRKDSGAEERLLANSFDELEPSLSPDERFMAYASDESGRREVYIRDMGGSGRRIQVSSEGGDEPVWSPKGNEIFYRRGSQMIAVPVSTRGDLTVGVTSVLFDVPFDIDPFNNDATNYDVTRDGQRFIMVQRATEPDRSRQQLNIVVNWTEELKRLGRAK